MELQQKQQIEFYLMNAVQRANGTTIKEIEDYKFYETYDKALEVGLHIAAETVA